MTDKERQSQRRRAEDAAFNRMLLWLLGAVVAELVILLVGMVVAFVVSMLAIKFLMGYIKKHDFKVFGWYRIVLGLVVLAYFFGVKPLMA